MHTGPHIKRDGLVFGYDTGLNPSSNFDHTLEQRRFFKGESTTNVIANPEPVSGWSVSNYQTSTATITYSSENGIPHMELSSVNVDGSYPRINMADLTSTITDGFTISFEARSNIADTQLGLALYSGGSTKTTQYATLSTDWQRFKFENLTTGYTLDDGYLRIPSTTSGAIYYIRRIQVEQKTHSTPFTTETRSSTQSLIDLTRTTTIDVSNVSFDSNGQPTFDGTDDYVDLGADVEISPINQGWTAEYVFNTNNAATLQHFNGCDEDVHNAGWLALLNSKLAVWNRSPGTWRYGDTVFSSNTWYHIMFIQTSGTTMQFYVNGQPEGGDHTSYSWNADKSAFFCRYVGKYMYLSNSSRYFNGEIPVAKLYNRALTASEVQQNYRAYKNRFNI